MTETLEPEEPTGSPADHAGGSGSGVVSPRSTRSGSPKDGESSALEAMTRLGRLKEVESDSGLKEDETLPPINAPPPGSQASTARGTGAALPPVGSGTRALILLPQITTMKGNTRDLYGGASRVQAWIPKNILENPGPGSYQTYREFDRPKPSFLFGPEYQNTKDAPDMRAGGSGGHHWKLKFERDDRETPYLRVGQGDPGRPPLDKLCLSPKPPVSRARSRSPRNRDGFVDYHKKFGLCQPQSYYQTPGPGDYAVLPKQKSKFFMPRAERNAEWKTFRDRRDYNFLKTPMANGKGPCDNGKPSPHYRLGNGQFARDIPPNQRRSPKYTFAGLNL